MWNTAKKINCCLAYTVKDIKIVKNKYCLKDISFLISKSKNKVMVLKKKKINSLSFPSKMKI